MPVVTEPGQVQEPGTQAFHALVKNPVCLEPSLPPASVLPCIFHATFWLKESCKFQHSVCLCDYTFCPNLWIFESNHHETIQSIFLVCFISFKIRAGETIVSIDLLILLWFTWDKMFLYIYKRVYLGYKLYK